MSTSALAATSAELRRRIRAATDDIMTAINAEDDDDHDQ